MSLLLLLWEAFSAVWPGLLSRIGPESSSSSEGAAGTLVTGSSVAASVVATAPLSSLIEGAAMPKKLLSSTPALPVGHLIESFHGLGVVFSRAQKSATKVQ